MLSVITPPEHLLSKTKVELKSERKGIKPAFENLIFLIVEFPGPDASHYTNIIQIHKI